MKSVMPLSRRSFISGVSYLALAGAFLPPFMRGGAVANDEFIVINGWVLKRSETA